MSEWNYSVLRHGISKTGTFPEKYLDLISHNDAISTNPSVQCQKDF